MAATLRSTTPIVVDQNASIAEDTASFTTQFDYKMQFNVNLSSLFSMSYAENSLATPNIYDVTTSVDTANWATQIGGTESTSNSTVPGTSSLTRLTSSPHLQVDQNSPYVGVINENEGIVPNLSVGGHLLQLAALAIFKHAKAHAAIVNDTDYYDIYATVRDKVSTSLDTDRNSIFKQYVNLGRITDSDDMNSESKVPMNLQGITLEFAMQFTGNTFKESTTTAINEGPGTDYPDSWNKQILLVFQDQQQS